MLKGKGLVLFYIFLLLIHPIKRPKPTTCESICQCLGKWTFLSALSPLVPTDSLKIGHKYTVYFHLKKELGATDLIKHYSNRINPHWGFSEHLQKQHPVC